MKLNYKIVITGGSGRFGSILKKKYKSNKLFYPNKNQLNILSTKSVESYLKNIIPWKTHTEFLYKRDGKQLISCFFLKKCHCA